MIKKQISKKDSFEKRDDDEMEELEVDGEKEFNPDSLDAALEDEDHDLDEENDVDVDDLDKLKEEEELEEDLLIEEEDENPFWKL